MEKEEASETILGPKDGRIMNTEIKTILNDLDELVSQGVSDTYLLYLYGMLKHKLNDDRSATEALIRAINLDPRNWAAWQELSALMADTASVSTNRERDIWYRAKAI